jgi:hypothetical protein
MTRGDVRELAAMHGFPKIKDKLGRTVVGCGHRLWVEWIRTASIRTLNGVVAALRQLEQPSTKPTKERQTPPAPKQHGPSEAQWKAVRTALEKYLAVGEWSHLTPRQLLQPFAIQWDRPDLPDKGAAAVTTFYDDGSAVIVLRSDRTPDQIHHDMLHELTHVTDAALICESVPMGVFTKEDMEARAEAVADWLAAL